MEVKPVNFLIKFVLLFGLLYGLNHFFTGILAPGGYYNKWADNNLDYVSAIRTFILNSAALLVKIFGYNAVTDTFHLSIPGIAKVRMVYSCIGLNILCFWIAFSIAFPQPFKSKITYLAVGIAIIFALNILRVSGLVLIRTIPSLKNTDIDHHLIFNIVVYGFIFLLIMRMVNKATKKPVANNNSN